MEFFNYCLLEGKKFQRVHRVVGFGLGQAPTSIGYYCIHAIFAGLVEDSSQARPTGISVDLKRLGEVHISKNRCSGTQPLQVIKGLLTPVIPLNGSLFLASILTQSQLMQGSGYLHEFWDKPPVISCESQETSKLRDVCGDWLLFDCFNLAFISGYHLGRDQDWSLFDHFYLAFISGYPLSRDHMPQVGNLPSEQLALRWLEFKSSLLQFPEHSL